MTEDASAEPKPATRLATEYLANERTFLAWVRTAIALVSLGFAVAKFDLWFRELGGRTDARDGSGAWSVSIGLAMIGFGGVLPVLAAWHYHATNRRIAHGRIVPNRGLVHLTTIAIVALAAVFIIYFLTHQG